MGIGVLFIEGPGESFTFELPPDVPVSVGRGTNAKVLLKDESKQISREHLELRRVGGDCHLKVLGQLGCTVRGRLLGSGAQATLAPGDVIVVGDFRLTVRVSGGADASPAPVAPAPFEARTGENRRLRDFLAPPAASPPAPSLTRWAKQGRPPATPETTGAPPPPVPGLDGRSRRPSDVLNDFISPARETSHDAPAPRRSGGFAWTPAEPQPQPQAQLQPQPPHPPRPKVEATPAWTREPPPMAAPAAVDPGPQAVRGGSSILGDWIQPAGAAQPAFQTAAPPAVPPAASPAIPPARSTGAARIDADADAAAYGPHGVAGDRAPSRDDEAARRCLEALAQGLGIEPVQAHTAEEWQRLGATLRLLLDGMRLLLSDRKTLRSELRVPDPTQFYQADNNPLKTELALPELVAILMASAGTSATYMPFDDAVQEVVDDLRSHNLAIIAAVRATVVGMIQEIDPQRLRTSLPGAAAAGSVPDEAPTLLERARLWKAYSERYAAMSANPADWIERVFDRHFVGAYSRELVKLHSR